MIAPEPPVPYHPQRRTEIALKLMTLVALLAVTALALGALAFYRQGRDERCFRSNLVASSRIGAEDRKVTDTLFAGFVYTLTHPSKDGIQQLVNELHQYQAARAADDKERVAHPVTGKC